MSEQDVPVTPHFIESMSPGMAAAIHARQAEVITVQREKLEASESLVKVFTSEYLKSRDTISKMAEEIHRLKQLNQRLIEKAGGTIDKDQSQHSSDDEYITKFEFDKVCSEHDQVCTKLQSDLDFIKQEHEDCFTATDYYKKKIDENAENLRQHEKFNRLLRLYAKKIYQSDADLYPILHRAIGDALGYHEIGPHHPEGLPEEFYDNESDYLELRCEHDVV